MNKSFFESLQWQLSLRMMGVGLVLGVVCSFFINELGSFWIGMVAGTACSIVKIYMLDATIEKALQMDKKQASLYTNLQYILRYTLTGLVLAIVAITLSPVGILGAGLGLFTMKLAVFMYQFQENRKK